MNSGKIVTSCGFAGRCTREKEEFLGISASEHATQHIDINIGSSSGAVDAVTSGWARTSKNEPSNQTGVVQGNLLGDESSQGEPHKINVRESKGCNESARCISHTLNC